MPGELDTFVHGVLSDHNEWYERDPWIGFCDENPFSSA